MRKKQCLLLVPIALILASCGTKQKPKYDITYYDGDEILSTVQVEEGLCAEEKTDAPNKQDYTFAGWYLDQEHSTLYDFSQEVKESFSLYAYYKPIAYFESYVNTYAPLYSPLELTNELVEGNTNPELVISAQGLDFSNIVTAKMIEFSGSLEDLEVTNVTIDNKTLKIKTRGEVKAGEGKVILAKAATKSNIYIACSTNVDAGISIDKYSYGYDLNNNVVSFKAKLIGKAFNNPDNLSPGDLLAKINKDELASINQISNYPLTFEITNIDHDFKGFNAKVQSTDENVKLADIADELKTNFKLQFNGELFEDKKAYETNLVIDEPIVTTSISLETVDASTYCGEFNIKLACCRLTDDIKNNKDNLLKDSLNKNLFISMPDSEILITDLSFPSDTEIKGSFELVTTKNLGNITVNLGQIKMNEETTIDPIRKAISDDAIVPNQVTAPYELIYNGTGDGTYNQSENGAYKGIKTAVEDIALADEENYGDIGQIVTYSTNIGKIAYGTTSGDYTMSQNALGDLLGVDSLRNPSNVIMDSLKAIALVLERIETQIQTIREKLDVIEEELQNIGQQGLLSNFLDAYNAWNAFMTDYYTPMTDEINLYNNAYFRYYYDLVSSSHTDDGEAIALKIYYDDLGELAFPDESGRLSVDGRTIDSSATKTIILPELVHALAGIRENGGHTYSDIENDILVDIASSEAYTNKELADIIKTLRFNAMYSYFSNIEKADQFSNIFTNFCNALTGGTSQVSVTPLDCYTTLLSTIYNFGFEIESDLNLAIVKLDNTYYCAKSIAMFADSINRSHSSEAKYNELNKKVRNELSSTRFYHSNQDGNIYSYATNSYLRYSLDGYGIKYDRDEDGDPDIDMIRSDSPSTGTGAYNKKNFSSISEGDAKLIGLKVQVYNKVFGTDYNTKTYLNKIGMIPDDKMDVTYGLIIGINGIIDDEDDVEDLDYYQPKLHRKDHDGEYAQADKYTVDVKYKSALKGTALSLEDNKTKYDGLCACYVKVGKHATSVSIVVYLEAAWFTGNHANQRNFSFPFVCYVYYVNFSPVD